MFQFKPSDSLAKKVNKVIVSHIETRGEKWFVSLGYGASNDFAESITNLIMGLTGEYTRFETVARYIRVHKARIRAKQALESKNETGGQ